MTRLSHLGSLHARQVWGVAIGDVTIGDRDRDFLETCLAMLNHSTCANKKAVELPRINPDRYMYLGI